MSPREEGFLPAQCRVVPIVPTKEIPPMRFAAVVQLGSEAGVGPSLILLGSSDLGRAYLGAMIDARDRLLAWLELWVQTSNGAGSGDGIVTNPELDLRWRRWAEAVGRDPTSIATGWETVHPRPVWLDVGQRRPVEPRYAELYASYELCTDDAALVAARLEPFSASTRRYLAVAGRPAAGFLAPTGEPPRGARPATAALPSATTGGLIPFNPEGGFLVVRRLSPLEWEAYAGLLAGRPVRGLMAGRPPVRIGGPYALLDDWDHLQQSGAYLFSSGRGRAGRFHETFHLKLLLLQSMLREVRAMTAATQLPCLNLDAGAFRVDLAPDAGALPILWTARAVLAAPPGAVPLAAGGGVRYFRPTGWEGTASIYRPEGAGKALRGRGELRIRRVNTSGSETRIEATVASAEIAGASPRDVVVTRLPLPGAGTITLTGTIDAAEALAQGEARFRTAPLETPPGVTSFPAIEGAVYPGTPFETIPMLSAPVDLFALGVLAVQLFLTGAGRPLPVAVDELLSLSRAIAGMSDGRPGERVRRLVAQDDRWREKLGPQHHGHGVSPEEAAGFLPDELWWDTLATLSRFFAGTGPDAFCRDFGDAPSHQIEAAFDAPLSEIDVLVLRSQSLLLCDWPANREIARVIQQVR